MVRFRWIQRQDKSGACSRFLEGPLLAGAESAVLKLLPSPDLPDGAGEDGLVASSVREWLVLDLRHRVEG